MKTATYPGRVEAVGQVVGPNHLGELFVATEAEFSLHCDGRAGDPRHNTTRVTFEDLTETNSEKVTDEGRLAFNARLMSDQKRVLDGGTFPVPEWHEMRRFQDSMAMRKPHLW